ncbi:hypothetical protein Tco_1476182 [Tanacetum coccineum]
MRGPVFTSREASPGSLLPGKQTSSAPGSCKLPHPDGTHDALSNQCRLVYLDLLLRRCRMVSWDSNLVDSFIDHIWHSESWEGERQKEHKRKSAARGVAPVRLWQEGCFRGNRRLKGSPSRGSRQQPVGMKPPAFATHHLATAIVAAANCLAHMSGLKKVRGGLLPMEQPP